MRVIWDARSHHRCRPNKCIQIMLIFTPDSRYVSLDCLVLIKCASFLYIVFVVDLCGWRY